MRQCMIWRFLGALKPVHALKATSLFAGWEAVRLLAIGSDCSGLQFDQLWLRNLAWPQYRYPRQRSAHHRYLVTRIQPGTHLAVLVDLVRQDRSIDHTKREVEEEIGDSSK